MSEKSPQRVGCYIDGFNLYYGLRDSDFRRYLWLDLAKLASHLILPHQKLSYTKYFTARISGGRKDDKPAAKAEMNAKRKRQQTYLEALQGYVAGLQIYEGNFLAKTVRCYSCQHTWPDAEEKMTDVNIATQLLIDTFYNRYDTALIVSADSDLVPPIQAVRTLFSHKRVIVAFPPGRNSKELRDVSSGQFIISKGHLKKSQLPDEIKLGSGYILKRPAEWIPPAPAT